MLNINPMSHYNKSNISFKSQKDFSKIYKEMEKITLIQEEKIIPKPNLEKQVEKKLTTSSILNKKNNYLSKISWVTGKTPYDKLQRALCVAMVFPIAYAVSMLFLLSHIFSDNKEQSSGNWVTEYVDKVQKIVTGNQNDTEQSFESDNLEKEAFFKADSLENLYKKDLISFDDCFGRVILKVVAEEPSDVVSIRLIEGCSMEVRSSDSVLPEGLPRTVNARKLHRAAYKENQV